MTSPFSSLCQIFLRQVGFVAEALPNQLPATPSRTATSRVPSIKNVGETTHDPSALCLALHQESHRLNVHETDQKRPGLFVERAAILSDGDIEPRHFSIRSHSRAWPPPSDLRVVEREMIERILHETEWNKSKAARRLGLTRPQLYGRLRRYGLDRPATDAAPS